MKGSVGIYRVQKISMLLRRHCEQERYTAKMLCLLCSDVEFYVAA